LAGVFKPVEVFHAVSSGFVDFKVDALAYQFSQGASAVAELLQRHA